MAEDKGKAGNADAPAPAEKAKAGKTVKVDIRRTAIHSRGTSYGPGVGIDVPVAVAERHGLTGAKAESRKSGSKAKATRRAGQGRGGRKA